MQDLSRFASFGDAQQHFARECQLVFASLQTEPEADRTELVHRIMEACPRPQSHAQLLLLRSIAVKTVLDLAAHLQSSQSVDWTRAGLLSGLARGIDPDQFRHMFDAALLAVCGGTATTARPRRSSRCRRHVGAALQALELHAAEQTLNLSAVARIVGVSSSHLDHLLTTLTGHGFREHLRRVRLLRSVTLLNDDRLSIKEVSASVGYRSPSEFDRQFRKQYGVTPSEWRDRRSVFSTCPPDSQHEACRNGIAHTFRQAALSG
jgi:AraC-like DNA-binding protein